MKTLHVIALLLFQTSLGLAQTTWYEIPTSTDKKLNAIHFPTPLVGYIGGDDSLLLKSIDGGETWNEVNYTGVTYYPGGEHIINVRFITPTIGYIATGPYGGTYKTSDGGLTWTALVPSGNLCFNEGLFFFDEQNGFIGGSGCFQGELIEKMTVGVLAPSTMNDSGLSADERIVDIDFLNSNFGMAASAGGRIFRTTDGGATWDSIPSGQTAGIPLTGIAIVDDTLAYAGYNDLGSGFGILRSSDGGLTWVEDLSSATFYYPAFLCVHNSGNGNVYSGAQPSWGTTGVIFESTGADMWGYYGVDQPIYDMTSYQDSIVFGVGDSGYVVVNVPFGTLSVQEETAESNLLVYPNPVTDDFYFVVPAKADLKSSTLSVYDLAGQLIYEVINPTENKMNVSFLTPGVYLVEFRYADSQTVTRIVKQ